MYGALWRHLPGPWPVKLVAMLLLAAAVVLVCFQWVFPWVADRLPWNDAELRVLMGAVPIPGR